MRRSVVLIVAVLLAWPWSGAVFAEKTPDEVSARNQMRAPGAEYDRKLRVARGFIRNGDYFNAANLLESLRSERPGDLSLYNQLKNCYRQLSLFDKLESMILELMTSQPGNYRFPIDLAESFAAQQRFDDARTAYDKALSLAKRDSETLSVLNSMSRSGLVDAAMQIMDSLDDSLRNSPAFIYERGQMYEMLKLYGEASGEYLRLISDSGRVAQNAERRLVSLLNFEPASASVETVLVAQMTEVPGGRLLEILASHFLKVGQFDIAYSLALRQDSLDGFTAEAPIRFMTTAREQGQPRQVIRMAEWVLQRHQESPAEIPTLFSLGEAQVMLGRYREAMANYRRIAAVSPNPRDGLEAIYSIGQVYLDYLDQYDSALVLFDSVAHSRVRTQASLHALRAIPFCYLRMGEFDEAYRQFEQLSDNRAMGREDWQEQFDYFRGMIRFCQGEFDSSEVALRKLMVDYPRGFYVNDALEMIQIMTKAAGDTALLNGWARVCRADLRKQTDSLKAALLAVTEMPNQALADLAFYLLIDRAVQEGAEEKALAYVNRMIEATPDSYYLPYALKAKADLLIGRADRRGEAESIYLELLQEHSEYPFASEVREKLRSLHPDDQIG